MMFAMWGIMMIGMMVPSAAPMMLLYAHVLRSRSDETEPLVPSAVFFAGYVTVWLCFSVIATLLQWKLEQAALLSPMMVSTSPVIGGVVLIVAAVYQWTPLKNVCLRHCRSPIWYLSTHWRHGVGGAYRMGLEHGAYCLGCCWILMALLFVGGVMNLLCVAAITIFVLLEKVAPFGRGLGRVGSIVLGVIGVAMMLGY
jgi:predicted metal-binding membrane protein